MSGMAVRGRFAGYRAVRDFETSYSAERAGKCYEAASVIARRDRQ